MMYLLSNCQHALIPLCLFTPQGSAKTKADAEKAFEDTMMLDGEVNGMMDQLSAAEAELAKKKAEADQDMMMASMVRVCLVGIPNGPLFPV